MKKIIVLLLAALIIVGLGVSCKEEPKVAPEETVDYVVESTIDTFGVFGEYVYALAYDEEAPADVKAEMDSDLEVLFETFFGEVEVESTVTSTSIDADIIDEDHINELKVGVTGLKYNETTESISGSFTMYAAVRYEGISKTSDVKGDFDISFTKKGVSSITYSSVKYNGTEYDLAAFNDAMKKLLENWPKFTAIGNWEVTIEGPITLSLTVTEDAFSLIMTEGGAQKGTATGTWVPDSLFTGVVTVTTSTGYAMAKFTPGEEVAFYADDENLTIKGYTFDRVDE